MAEHEHVRVAVIGSGFGGLGAAVRLRREGITDFVVLERASGVGGTWRDNSYPGCACDVPSHLYSFSFAPNPDWPRAFSGQEHIRAYLEHVADTFGLRPHLRFGSEVKLMTWDAERLRWNIETASGSLSADMVVSATGPLSDPKIPAIPGLDSFPGKVFHSARWDHDYDLRGKRVAMVGTGASAIQIVPEIQPKVGRLTLFQRTPPWVMPRVDRAISGAERRLHRALPFTTRLRRGLLWGIRELQVQAFTKHPEELGLVERLAKRNMARAIKDPALRAKLTPDYRIGCKRILLSNAYYPALARPNVDVVASGLSEVRGSTVVAADGTETEVDAIIFGTGFHVTDMPIAERVVGVGGVTLAESWKGGMQALRGGAAAGFPNWLSVIGPNTGLGNSSMILMIESQLNYLADYLRQLDVLGGRAALDARPAAVDAWNDRVQERMRRTVWNNGGCTSWYLDASGRNTTLWPGTTAEFRRAVRRVDLGEYEVIRARGTTAPEPPGAASAAAGTAEVSAPAASTPAAGTPAAEASAAGAPAAGALAAQEPAAGALTAEQPAAEAPAASTPAAGKPAAGKPAARTPAARTPAANTPAAGAPAAEASAAGASVVEEPAAGVSAASTSAAGKPAAGTPAAGALAAGAPVASTPAASTSAAGKPAAGTPAAGTPAVEASAAGAPAVEEPAAKVSAASTPAVGAPAAGEPAVGTPAVGTPAAGEPAVGTPAAGTPSAGKSPAVKSPAAKPSTRSEAGA